MRLLNMNVRPRGDKASKGTKQHGPNKLQNKAALGEKQGSAKGWQSSQSTLLCINEGNAALGA